MNFAVRIIDNPVPVDIEVLQESKLNIMDLIWQERHKAQKATDETEKKLLAFRLRKLIQIRKDLNKILPRVR